MTKQIVFEVPDEVADLMTRASVYLDIHGGVRWVAEPYGDIIKGTSRWYAVQGEAAKGERDA